MLVKALAWMGVNTSHFYAYENGKIIELFMAERTSLWQQRQHYQLISTVKLERACMVVCSCSSGLAGSSWLLLR
jgi:hypothetical protein